VAQHGPRRLWDEIEALHLEWVRLGSPARDRLGLTVASAGEHRFWLDNPQATWWAESVG
jgi:protein-L-isoaspartate(D-aspartate) O-methyltransferase